MISTQIARLEYYNINVNKEDLYNLQLPTIRFSAGLF